MAADTSLVTASDLSASYSAVLSTKVFCYCRAHAALGVQRSLQP